MVAESSRTGGGTGWRTSARRQGPRRFLAGQCCRCVSVSAVPRKLAGVTSSHVQLYVYPMAVLAASDRCNYREAFHTDFLQGVGLGRIQLWAMLCTLGFRARGPVQIFFASEHQSVS
jgi:hypothetical protein